MPEKAKAKILVVEDDPEISGMVCQYLKKHGFVPKPLFQGKEVFEMLEDVDLLVLDLNLPDIDGLDILKKIRQESSLPILIMSARAEGADRVLGLEMGADDYLTKPILPPELVARIKALLRRSNGTVCETLAFDDKSRIATIKGNEISLTGQEFKILKFLAEAPGKTFSRDELIALLWGEQAQMRTRRVDLILSKVRVKFEDLHIEFPIQSVWGVGYRYALTPR